MLASAGTLLVLIALPCTAVQAAESAVTPLPASDYTVRHVCAAPAPGYAGCLALELVPKTAAARAHTHPLGITPAPAGRARPPRTACGRRLRPAARGSAQHLSAADHRHLRADDRARRRLQRPQRRSRPEGLRQRIWPARMYRRERHASSRSTRTAETGNLPFPASNEARKAEEAICETGTGEAKEEACKEVEEADGWATRSRSTSRSPTRSARTARSCSSRPTPPRSSISKTAEETAARLPATEISNSWGGPEPRRDTERRRTTGAFNHPGIVITAAAGDDGYLDWDAEEGAEKGFADYPASSPHVVAVGGTRLLGPLGPGGTWRGETVWNGDGAGGSGCSSRFAAPPWQQSASDWRAVGCGNDRAVADVSADADPYTGVAIYDSTREMGIRRRRRNTWPWCTIGGTSLASPLIASVFALAGGAGDVEYPAETLYEKSSSHPASLHDVISGSNGECSKPSTNTHGLRLHERQEAASCSQQAICLAGRLRRPHRGRHPPRDRRLPSPGTKQSNASRGSKSDAKKNGCSAQEREELTAQGKGRQKKRRNSERRLRQWRLERQRTRSTGAGRRLLPEAARPADPSSHDEPPPPPARPTIRLTAFALTPSALLALNRVRPRVSSVQLRLHPQRRRARARRTRQAPRGPRAQALAALPYALTLAGARGRDRARLSAHGVLTPGSYRLTLTPVHGSAHTLTFQLLVLGLSPG